MNVELIRLEYPEILSSEQVRQILCVSKRKVSWLLNNGYIKCEINSNKTRRFRVNRDDLILYIIDCEDNPNKYIFPSGEFSSKKQKKKFNYFPDTLPPDFKPWLEYRWRLVPDVLTVDKIINVTGYSANTVNRWINTGRLRIIQLPNDVVTPKEWLIEFYCTLGYKPGHMCKKHIRLVRDYLRWKEVI